MLPKLTMPFPSAAFDRASQLQHEGLTCFVQGRGLPEAMRSLKAALVEFQALLVDFDHQGAAMPPTPQTNTCASSTCNPIRMVEVPGVNDPDFYIHRHAFLISDDGQETCNDGLQKLTASIVLSLFNMGLLLTQSNREETLQKACSIYQTAIQAAEGENLLASHGFNLVVLAAMNNQAWLLKKLGRIQEASDLLEQMADLIHQARHCRNRDAWSHEEYDIILNFMGNLSTETDGTDLAATHYFAAPSA